MRKIPKNYRNITGIAAHKKALGQAGFESTLERDFLTLLQFRPDIEHFEVQPYSIGWNDDSGKFHTYTPDVFVVYKKNVNRRPTVFEIKYQEDFRANWLDYKHKFASASDFCLQKGFIFRLVSDKAIRTPFFHNAKFLLPFVSRGSMREDHMDLLDGKLTELSRSTPNELLAAIFRDEWHRAELIPTLWYLIGTFQVGIDLGEPMSMTSPIWSIDNEDWDELAEVRFQKAKRQALGRDKK